MEGERSGEGCIIVQSCRWSGVGQGRFGVARGVVTYFQTWLTCSERGAVSMTCAVCVADWKGRESPPTTRERVKLD